MPSYPAKPYVVPLDDWFDNNSSHFENEAEAKGTKDITIIHEFFYRQSHLKVGGSDNLIQTTLEKKSSEKIIISSHRNYDKHVSSRNEENYSYSKIPKELKSIKKRTFKAKPIYKNLSNKNTFNLKSYLLDIKYFFIKIISRKNRHN
tara:strand:- start:83 stop:523 length:441 start_codon:yes stop_codon:yes gene_type:complete